MNGASLIRRQEGSALSTAPAGTTAQVTGRSCAVPHDGPALVAQIPALGRVKTDRVEPGPCAPPSRRLASHERLTPLRARAATGSDCVTRACAHRAHPRVCLRRPRRPHRLRRDRHHLPLVRVLVAVAATPSSRAPPAMPSTSHAHR